MDVARERLIGTLERLSAELTRGGALAPCLRRLPRAEHHQLCAPLGTAGPRPRARAGALTAAEALALARLALVAGSQEPDRLAEQLAELAAELRGAAP